jgi:MYXO-CTERM domain-containing protein
MPSPIGKLARHGVPLAPIALLGATVLLSPARAAAHFMIDTPTTPPQAATVQSWMSEDSVGGPQKNGPCAATPNTSLGDSAGTPTNAITVVQPGQKVTIPVTATVPHPGWYRIALAQGASSTQTLTTIPDPKAQTGTNCTPAIMSNPVWSTTQPILADGLPAGSTASTQQSGSQKFQVTIPSNASCSMAQPCSLQVIMVMTDHPKTDCYYHHCADVAVSSGGGSSGSGGSSGAGGASGTGGAGGRGQGGSIGSGAGGTSTASGGSTGSGGSASGGSTGSGGSASGGSTGSGGSASGGSTGSGGSASGGSPGSGGNGSGGNGASASGGASQSGGTTGAGGDVAPPPPGSSGCTCAVAESPHTAWAFGAAGLLALVIARRRRR